MYGTVSTACRRAPHICRIARPSFCTRQVSPETRMKAACSAEAQKASKVVVRWPGGSDSMVISVETQSANKILNRDPTEPVETSLARLQASLGGKKQKRRKKGKGDGAQEAAAGEADVTIKLLQNEASSTAVPGGTPNSEAWGEPAVLCIGSEVISIDFNPPTVTSLEIQPRPMVSYPVLPLPALQYASPPDCIWLWERVRQGDGSQSSVEVLDCTERLYVPVGEDASCRLQVTCTPVASTASGQRADVVSLPLPEALGTLPAPVPAATGRSIRVVTYNILADQYASQEFARDVLFKHCPRSWLDIHYRKQLVCKQLLHSAADVMCLQEVDAKVFDFYLAPLLKTAGFSGVFDNKAGQVMEGSAIFYRDSLFECTGRRRVDLPEVFTAPLPAHLSHFQPLLAASPHLTEALQRVSTVAQAVALQPRQGSRLCSASGATAQGAPAATPPRPLVVCNTHLFFHSNAAHIRTMHVDAIVMEAFELVRESHNGAVECGAAAAPPAVILCGDLNSDLNDGMPGTIELLRSGQLPATHWDWAAGAHFSFGNGRSEQPAPPEAGAADLPETESDAALAAKNLSDVGVTGVDLQLPSRFQSAHPLDLETVSNYVPGYKGLLDYIWCEVGGVRPVRTFPLPTPAQLRAFVPDGVNPSDHLPVVADVEVVAMAAVEGARRGGCGATSDGAAAARRAARGEAGEDGNVNAAKGAGLDEAVGVLRSGGVVAVPTDTLYGLAALGRHDEGIERIYDIKGRATSVPLAVCVGKVEEIAACGQCGGLPEGLLAALLPGPVTVIVARRDDAPLSERLNPGLTGVAVRVPDSGFIRDVVCGVGAPVVLTSANRSGQDSTVEVGEFREMWGEVDAVFDGGRIEGSREGSTIVDLQQAQAGRYMILRDGSARGVTEAVLHRFGLQLERAPAEV